MFNDLVCNVEFIKETESDMVSDMSDNEIEVMYRETALNDVRIDVITKLGITIDDTKLDDYFTKYESVFEMLLRYKQLYYFYYNRNDVEGKNKDREKSYNKQYVETLSRVGFFNLESTYEKFSRPFLRY